MTADLAWGAAVGLAIAFAIAAVILMVRPVHSAPAVYVPKSFSPSPAAPCPPLLRGRPDCAEATP
jgi:hypothetical protein